MTALKILGCTAGCAVVGLVSGLAWSSRHGQDLDLAGGMDLLFDAVAGTFVGVVGGVILGCLLFTSMAYYPKVRVGVGNRDPEANTQWVEVGGVRLPPGTLSVKHEAVAHDLNKVTIELYCSGYETVEAE